MPERQKAGWSAMQVAVAAIAALVSVGGAGVSFTHCDTTQADRVQRLERYCDSLGAELVELRQRVLMIERPDEPVFPPRDPGRLGTLMD